MHDPRLTRFLERLHGPLRGAGGAEADGPLLGRFIDLRDEDAFAELVRRHGPMVFGVCRRVTGDAHEAEEAFQATFLVLARRAASVRPRELVGNWLFGVACRSARAARRAAARRRAREKPVDPLPERPCAGPAGPTDLPAVLDEELARLPDKYRAAVVLCELEGRARREVAHLLGIPEGTLSSRLAAARKLLASRLARRGLAAAGAGSMAHGPGDARASVPAALVAAASRPDGGAPLPVQHLAHSVSQAMLSPKLKFATWSLIAACLLAGGVAAARQAWAQEGAADARPAAAGPRPGRPAPEPGRDALRDTLLILDKQFWEACSRHDVATVDKLLADDCVHLAPSRQKWDKAAWLHHLTEARSEGFRVTSPVEMVRLGPSAALLSYEARWKAVGKDGSQLALHRRFLWGYAQKDGGWQIKYVEFSDVDPAPREGRPLDIPVLEKIPSEHIR